MTTTARRHPSRRAFARTARCNLRAHLPRTPRARPTNASSRPPRAARLPAHIEPLRHCIDRAAAPEHLRRFEVLLRRAQVVGRVLARLAAPTIAPKVSRRNKTQHRMGSKGDRARRDPDITKVCSAATPPSPHVALCLRGSSFMDGFRAVPTTSGRAQLWRWRSRGRSWTLLPESVLFAPARRRAPEGVCCVQDS